MSASRKITAVQFVEWMHKHRYAKYWGSDKPNCEKWYVMNTMPDRKYYTLEELYDIFEREQNDYKQQSNCNKPAVSGVLPDQVEVEREAIKYANEYFGHRDEDTERGFENGVRWLILKLKGNDR